MKAEIKLWFCTALILFLLSLVSEPLSGQKKGEISFGMGYPELANLGIKYRIFKQVRTAVTAGWLPRATFKRGGWDDLLSFSGDIYYHFGRTYHYSDLKLFYVRVGLNAIMQKPFLWEETWWNTSWRVGGEIFSSKKIGVTIDGGVIYNLNPESNWAHMDRFMPAFGTTVVYRF
jgi:hypothetical protein